MKLMPNIFKYCVYRSLHFNILRRLHCPVLENELENGERKGILITVTVNVTIGNSSGGDYFVFCLFVWFLLLLLR